MLRVSAGEAMTENLHKQETVQEAAGTHGTQPHVVPPELMTESELIDFLRIPEVSTAENHHHVIENLKRMRGLPTIHICNRTLYPLKAVRGWVEEQTQDGK